MFVHESGINQSFINLNGRNRCKNLRWNANYDGKVANISVKSNNNGNEKTYNFMLDNNDLANILNVNTNDKPIDERLYQDFKQKNMDGNLINKPTIIEFDNGSNYMPPNIQQMQNIKGRQDLNDLDLYLPMIIKKQPTNLMSFPKKISSRRRSTTSSSKRKTTRHSSTRKSKSSSKRSSITKPKSHKIYKIYKNSKSIGYLKHKKSSKSSKSSKTTL